MHLERFKTEDAIVAAKSEITETAHTVVLNVDDPHLAALASRLAAAGTKSVVRCSAVDPAADVCVEAAPGVVTIHVGGSVVGSDISLPGSVRPTNLACALAVVLAQMCIRDRPCPSDQLHHNSSSARVRATYRRRRSSSTASVVRADASGISPALRPMMMTVCHCSPLARWNVVRTTLSRSTSATSSSPSS